MEAIKCTHCDVNIVFDPASLKWVCPMCHKPSKVQKVERVYVVQEGFDHEGESILALRKSLHDARVVAEKFMEESPDDQWQVNPRNAEMHLHEWECGDHYITITEHFLI